MNTEQVVISGARQDRRPPAIAHSPVRLLALLAASIFTVEAFVMQLLNQRPATMHGWPVALLDGGLLIFLLFPALHFFAFRPLVERIREQERAEQLLRQSRDELEKRVEERTAKLAQANQVLEAEITERKRVELERVRLIGELQQTLAEVKQLSGLLPICAGCKKIRDDHGYWKQIESYIAAHSQATFTHGLCPECGRKYFPGLELPAS